MINETENAAALKAQYIISINSLKNEAIKLGFDYPTENIENESLQDLIKFQFELLTYIFENS